MKSSPKPTSTIGQRLKFEMKKRGISSAELAKQAAVKTSFLYDVISGKSAHPSTITLARVAETLGVNLEELVGGSGGETPGLSPRIRADDYITVPRVMVDDAKKGTLVATLHDTEPYVLRKSWIAEHLGAKPADLRLLTVRGDSMEPTLCHNDTILIDTSKTLPSPPGMFVVFDGGLVAKRLETTSGKTPRIRVMSDNTKYSAYERSSDELLIIGRVVWFGREI